MAIRGITPTTETFGAYADTAPAVWQVYTPTSEGPWPGVLVEHGGGFDKEEQAPKMMATCASDLATAGFIAFAPHYRLAPPGAIAGQVTDGRYPQQHVDMALAITTARADSRTIGDKLGGVGGSAGGAHVAYACGVGTPGADRLDVGIDLSGAHNYAERTANPNLTAFVANVTNYNNTTNLTTLLANSPMTLVDALINPLFMVNSSLDSMPIQQQADMIAALTALGVTNFMSTTLAGRGHAFALWPQVKVAALAFLSANLT